MWPLQ
jgi:hypothetical protein